jgi:hypothetical protein
MASNGEFSRFVTEFGSKDKSTERDGEVAGQIDLIDDAKTRARQNAVSGSGMMQVKCFVRG